MENLQTHCRLDYSNKLNYQTMKTKSGKPSIALINASIELKKGNGKMGYNFYEWLIQTKKDLCPETSLFELWLRITFAYTTETSCFTKIPLK